MAARTSVPVVIATVLVAAVALAADSTQVQKPAAAPAQAQASSAPALGKVENAKWSATTLEAAATEANKEALKKAEPKTITGEVIDVSCYLQLGKRGDAHIDCGSKCIRNGQPVGLLEDDGDVYLLIAEEHHPRRDGMTDLNRVFLPLLAKTVTVSGMEVERKGDHALFVSAEELGAMKKAAVKAKAGR